MTFYPKQCGSECSPLCSCLPVPSAACPALAAFPACHLGACRVRRASLLLLLLLPTLTPKRPLLSAAAEGYIRLYRLEGEGRRLELLHKTEVSSAPACPCAAAASARAVLFVAFSFSCSFFRS